MAKRSYDRKNPSSHVSAPCSRATGDALLRDLLRPAENLERPTLGDSSIVRQMLTPRVVWSGHTTAYGLAIALERDRGPRGRGAEHEGRNPGFPAYLGRRLEPKLTVAVLCKSTAPNAVGSSTGQQSSLGKTAQAPLLLRRIRQSFCIQPGRLAGRGSISSRRPSRLPS